VTARARLKHGARSLLIHIKTESLQRGGPLVKRDGGAFVRVGETQRLKSSAQGQQSETSRTGQRKERGALLVGPQEGEQQGAELPLGNQAVFGFVGKQERDAARYLKASDARAKRGGDGAAQAQHLPVQLWDMPADEVLQLALRNQAVAVDVARAPQLLQLPDIQVHEPALNVLQQLITRALARFFDCLSQLHRGGLERARRHHVLALLGGEAAERRHHGLAGHVRDAPIQKKLQKRRVAALYSQASRVFPCFGVAGIHGGAGSVQHLDNAEVPVAASCKYGVVPGAGINGIQRYTSIDCQA
jgi:hypothetical protein